MVLMALAFIFMGIFRYRYSQLPRTGKVTFLQASMVLMALGFIFIRTFQAPIPLIP